MLVVNNFRYWEAIKKWDEALLYTPCDEKVYEMKAQVHHMQYFHMSLHTTK